jgi:hypothetical protein
MKAINSLVLIFSIIFMLPAFSQTLKASIDNEIRVVKFAEQEVMIDLTLALSPSVHSNGEIMELAIGLIGISKGDYGANALVNLLRLRLDGAGSEELSCQILTRGKPLLPRLERMNARAIAASCQTDFAQLKKRELAHVPDVTVEQVCRSEAAILSVQTDLIQSVKLKVACPY